MYFDFDLENMVTQYLQQLVHQTPFVPSVIHVILQVKVFPKTGSNYCFPYSTS